MSWCPGSHCFLHLLPILAVHLQSVLVRFCAECQMMTKEPRAGYTLVVMHDIIPPVVSSFSCIALNLPHHPLPAAGSLNICSCCHTSPHLEWISVQRRCYTAIAPILQGWKNLHHDFTKDNIGSGSTIVIAEVEIGVELWPSSLSATRLCSILLST